MIAVGQRCVLMDIVEWDDTGCHGKGKLRGTNGRARTYFGYAGQVKITPGTRETCNRHVGVRGEESGNLRPTDRRVLIRTKQSQTTTH